MAEVEKIKEGSEKVICKCDCRLLEGVQRRPGLDGKSSSISAAKRGKGYFQYPE